MRITIGGLLLLGGAGTTAVLGPMHLPEAVNVDVVTQQVRKSFDGMHALFKSGASNVSLGPALSAENQETTAAPAPLPTETTAVPNPPPVVEEKKPETVEAPAPVPAARPQKRARKRRSRRRANAPAASPKPAAGKSEAAVDDKLMGSYVALKLKTGRDVKGIMRGKTATQYTIELPGMGPFTYPVSNVVSVTPAE